MTAELFLRPSPASPAIATWGENPDGNVAAAQSQAGSPRPHERPCRHGPLRRVDGEGLNGLLGLLARRNHIKLLIAVEIVGKGISLLLVATGFAKGSLLTAQALVVTFIVVEVSLVATALALIINIYKRSKSLDIRALTKLKG